MYSEVFRSDLMPTHSLPGLIRYTVVINTDIHTEHCSQWVDVHIKTNSSSYYYYDSYVLFLLVLPLRNFLQRACTLGSYNTRTTQGFTTDVCGQYAFLCVLHGPGTGPSPISRPFWDDEAGPAGGDSSRAGVWPAASEAGIVAPEETMSRSQQSGKEKTAIRVAGLL